MLYSNIKTLAEAFDYVLDCNLATAETLAMRKRPPKAELRRHLSIVQKGIEALEAETDPPHEFSSRTKDIVALWETVPLEEALRSWAQDIHLRHHGTELVL